jgi:D-alanyl-lipoteichoic acid acyltransferase DltB (MBOAT superfamily)
MIIFPISYAPAAIIASAAAVLCLPLLRRQYGYLVLSLLVASVVYWNQFFGYLLWIVLVFAFARIVEGVTPLEAKLQKKRWTYACAGMLVVIAIFFAGSVHILDLVSVRAFGVLWKLPDHDMWLLLRTISFLWEFGSGRLKKPGFVDYVIWISFPFTLLGPLIRASEFFPQYGNAASERVLSKIVDQKWWRKLLLASAQMIIGAGLDRVTAVLSDLGPHWPKLFIVFGTGPWAFFLATSGTFHLMECLAHLWGIELPPSFNYPFGQMNLREFWARWNMTVTRICTDYLFYNRWGFRKANVYFNLMMVFLAVGLWHGMNPYWGTWGILHGIGFCVYVWYRTDRERFAFARSIGTQRLREIGSAGATYVFVCLCWYVANKIVLGLHHGPLPNHLN